MLGHHGSQAREVVHTVQTLQCTSAETTIEDGTSVLTNFPAQWRQKRWAQAARIAPDHPATHASPDESGSFLGFRALCGRSFAEADL